MTDQECSGAGIGNLSIGQGQTLVTPLQIARMTAIVASDGVDHGAHILLSEKTGKRRILSKDTARQIRSMMCLVTEEGTAQNMGLVDPDGSAGSRLSKPGLHSTAGRRMVTVMAGLQDLPLAKIQSILLPFLQGDQIERLPMPDRYTGASSNT